MRTVFLICSMLLTLGGELFAQYPLIIGTKANTTPQITHAENARAFIQQHIKPGEHITDMRIEWSREENAFLLIAKIKDVAKYVVGFVLTEREGGLYINGDGIFRISCMGTDCLECDMINDVCACVQADAKGYCRKVRNVIW